MTADEKQTYHPRMKALAEVLRELEKNGLVKNEEQRIDNKQRIDYKRRIEKKINIKLRYYKFVYYKTGWIMLNCLKQQKMMIFIL